MTRNHNKSVTSAFASPTLALAALALVSLASIQPANAQTLTPLHNFPQFPTTDGETPTTGLVLDAYGNLFGTTLSGGAHEEYLEPYYFPGPGTVFKVTPNGRESVLYSFGATVNSSGNGYSDGAYPSSDLVVDRESNLYGTTQEGGSMNLGTIFKVTKSGVETVLHSFSCSDGAYPIAGLVMDGRGDLYGTASEGGSGATSCSLTVPTGNGVLFKLNASGVYTVLHNFGGSPSDVTYPMGTLELNGGDLYGMADGGQYGNGSIFKFSPIKKSTHPICSSVCTKKGGKQYNPLVNKPTLIFHADWGSKPSKRWCAKATLGADGRYTASGPSPVGEPTRLIENLKSAVGGTGIAFTGFDFPIGVPAHFADRAGITKFRDFLAKIGSDVWADFYSVCDNPAQISMHRPFYPNGSYEGRRKQDLFRGHGVTTLEPLLRRCELGGDGQRQACCLFWTLGGNQVGKAALIGWRDVLAPALRNGSGFRLWPFDGPLQSLFTYPSDQPHLLSMSQL